MDLEIVSCNVNGLRAAYKKGFLSWMKQKAPLVVGMQEVRAERAQLSRQMHSPDGYASHFVTAKRPGYSGVGLYAAIQSGIPEASFAIPQLDEVEAITALGKEQVLGSFDDEGRIQCVRLGRLLIVNVYFPNGNGKERDNSRVPYKLEFYERLRLFLKSELEADTRVLVMGDYNTAHQAVDLARPQQNLNTSGFLLNERAALDLWTSSDFVDTFRHFCPAPTAAELLELQAQAKSAGKKKAERDAHPGEGKYTWWSQRAGARERNVGWRIDYIMASHNLVPYLRGASIYADVRVSDHCPISVHLDPGVLV